MSSTHVQTPPRFFCSRTHYLHESFPVTAQLYSLRSILFIYFFSVHSIYLSGVSVACVRTYSLSHASEGRRVNSINKTKEKKNEISKNRLVTSANTISKNTNRFLCSHSACAPPSAEEQRASFLVRRTHPLAYMWMARECD